MPTRILMVAALLGVICLSTGCQTTPLQVSIWPPAQLAPETWDVAGLRLDVPYGKNRNVYGLDAGMWSVVTEDVAGLQVGFWNAAASNVYGVQISTQLGMMSHTGNVYGWQVSGGISQADHVRGSQVGLLCWSPTMAGFQSAALFNAANTLNGVQLGAVNYCREGSAFQFGILNFNKKGFLPIFPIVNVSMGAEPAAE